MTDSPGLQVRHEFGGWSAHMFPHSVSVTGAGKLVFLSGMAAEDMDGGQIRYVGDIGAQARYCYEKIAQVLAGHGGSLADVVKVSAYVTDPDHLEPYIAERLRAFEGLQLPAHTFVVVRRLARPEMLVEVDATAVIALPADPALPAERAGGASGIGSLTL